MTYNQLTKMIKKLISYLNFLQFLNNFLHSINTDLTISPIQSFWFINNLTYSLSPYLKSFILSISVSDKFSIVYL